VDTSLAQQFYDEGKKLACASGSGIATTLNEILNRYLSWPFRAATGAAVDLDSLKTPTFGTLIYTASGPDSAAEPVEISADSLACVVDVSESVDLAGFQSAYGRIAQVKRLRKSKPPETKGVPQTTTTLGIIFVANTTIPVETLAGELDRLNQETPSWQWPDMIAVQSKATINYAVQFPGEKILGDFLPPAEGALAGGVPPMYIIIAMKPTGLHTFNRMCAFIIAHLAIFSPGAALPKWVKILENTPKDVIALCGYQYNLRGDLLPVPRQYYNDRYFPPSPLRIEDPQGNLLSTIQFLPWQDGGVVLLRGKLPLEGLLVFLGKEALKGKITRDGLQVSYVIPITQSDFNVLLQRIQRQSNMRVRNDSTQWVVQKFADEGSSSPFMARLFIGMMHLRDAVLPDPAKRQAFDKSYEFVMMTLLNTRTTAQDIARLFADHARRVANGEVARIQGQALHIDENIDKELRKQTENFLNGAVRLLKQGMQDVTNALGINIGFLFRQATTFATGIAALRTSDPDLADYLSHARRWTERLVESRNALEHTASVLPKIQYSRSGDSIQAHEPQISNQPVTELVKFMLDRLACFVEEVTAHCLQAKMPAGLSIREILLAHRLPEVPERFQNTLKSGGTNVWRITYHQSTFEET
jgi:hypothetical protein